MLRIAKYLKPFAWTLALVFVLLFAQAMCDLNLPNYMSKIVNVGIQQNGIERAAPDQISTRAMGFIQNFMTDGQKSEVNAAYEQSADRYTLIDRDNAPNEAFEQASSVMITLAKQQMQQRGADTATQAETRKMDLTQMYQFEPMLKLLPQQKLDEARAEAAQSPEMMSSQYGIAMVEAYYSELGLDIAAIQRGYIVGVGLKMLLIALLGGICTVLVGLLAARMAAGVSRSLRRDIFAKVESFSSTEVNKFGVASLITRNTNDVSRVQMLIMMGTRMLLYAPIMVVGGVIMALSKSLSMSWILALAGVVLIGLMSILFSVAMPKFKLIQKLTDKLNLVSRENLTGLMVIRAFGTREHEEERFDEVNRDLRRVNLFVNRAMALMMPVMTLIMSGTSLLTVWVGAHQVAQSSMQVGDMMAFMQYALQILSSFLMLSMMMIFAPQASVSAGRIADVLETEPSIVDPIDPKPFDAAKKGVVEFRDVSFRYVGAEEYALEHISFTAHPGQTTAFIGSTGSGKSTIANLILRFYDATEGQVLLGGTDVRDVTQKALRDKIGYVPQKGVLLSGTIKSNIGYGGDHIADDGIRAAAEVAQALEFIEHKPKGFDDEIAQGGANVSGGQKQRLSIARALAKDPEVFIFDDSFSALDFKTDAALRKALKAHSTDATVLIVAQRVSTIMDAEQIIVLEQGRIVGRGTHSQLLKSCPEYREIAQSQLSEEELA